jgi:hypothetical protein
LRIEWAVACRYVEVHDGLATMVGAGVDFLAPGPLPSPVGVMFVMRLAIAPGDDGDHELEVGIRGPDMQPVGEPLKAMIHTEGQPHAQPGWEGHHFQPIAVGFEAAELGCYTVVFSVDGKSSIDCPLVLTEPPS